MTRNSAMVLTLTLAGVLIAATGCDPASQQDKDLLAHQQALSGENQALRNDVERYQQENASLHRALTERDNQLRQMELQLDSAYADLQMLDNDVELAGGWERTVAGDRVSLGSDILFSSGSATLSDAGEAQLNRIAGDLRSTYGGMPVRVYGYTDSDPITRSAELWEDNLDLSANRAMAVTRYLRSRGIPAEDIETIAMGQTNPVASNSNDAGKEQNRRVEIIVVR
jgi:flagellar motor protein MotB